MTLRKSLLACILAASGAAVSAAPLQAANAHVMPRVVKHIAGRSVVMAVVINNLDSFSRKVGLIAPQLNIPIPGSLLQMLTKELHLSHGLNRTGSAALVVMKSKPNSPPGEPPMAMLLPAKNFTALIAPFNPQAGPHGVYTVSMPDDSTPSAAVKLGHFAVLAPNLAALQRYLKQQGPLRGASRGTLREFKTHDLEIYLNFRVLAPMTTALLAKAQGEIMPMMQQEPASTKMEVKLVFSMYMSALKRYLPQIRSNVFGLRLSNAGLTFGNATQVARHGELSQLISAQHPLGKNPLAALPGGKFVTKWAWNFNGAAANALADHFKQGFFKRHAWANKVKISPAIGKFIKKELAISRLTRTSSGEVIMSHPQNNSGMLRNIVVLKTPHPKRLAADLTYALSHAKTLDVAIAQQMGTAAPSAAQQRWATRTITIGGVKVTDIRGRVPAASASTSSTSGAAASPDAQKVQNVMKNVYGPAYHADVAALPNHRVLYAYDVPHGKLSKLVGALQGQSLAAQNQVKALAGRVLPHPILVMLVSTDRFTELTEDGVAAANNVPSNAVVTGGATMPMVISANSQTSTVVSRTFLPLIDLQHMVNTAEGYVMQNGMPNMP